jgi:glutamate/aspartate transport system substrate-binding protein
MLQRILGITKRGTITTKGTTSVELIKTRDVDRVMKITYRECTYHKDCFLSVARNEADAFIMDDIVLHSFRASAPDPQDFMVIGELLSVEPLSIMFSKNDAELKRVIDREMSRMIIELEIHALYKRWFLSEIPDRQINLNIPMSYLLKDSLRFPTDKVND